MSNFIKIELDTTPPILSVDTDRDNELGVLRLKTKSDKTLTRLTVYVIDSKGSRYKIPTTIIDGIYLSDVYLNNYPEIKKIYISAYDDVSNMSNYEHIVYEAPPSQLKEAYITYKIVADILFDSQLKTFYKEFTDKIVGDNLYGNEFVLKQCYILDLFSEEIEAFKKEHDFFDIVVDGFEISNNNVDVDVFFESPNSEELSMYPFIKAYIKPIDISAPSPILMYEIIDNTSVRWFWEKDTYAHYLKSDLDDRYTVSNIPTGVSEYIETGLTSGKTYSRYLIAYDGNSISKDSNSCKFTLGTEVKPKYSKFKRELYEEIANIGKLEVITEKLSAFKSGVGHGIDCLISKDDLDSFSKSFNIISSVYGICDYNSNRYNTTKFKYRFKMSAEFDKLDYYGSVKFFCEAFTVQSIESLIYRYATKPINVKWKLKAKAIVFKKDSNQKINKEFITDMSQYSFTQSVTLNEATGTVSLDVMPKTDVSGNSIKSLIHNVGLNDDDYYWSANNGKDILIYDYYIEDDYQFDSTLNKFKKSSERLFGPGSNGTIHTYINFKKADDGVTDIPDPDSHVYSKGLSEACVFEIIKVAKKQSSGDQGVTDILSQQEIDNLIPICISDNTYLYDGDSSYITTRYKNSTPTDADATVTDNTIVNPYKVNSDIIEHRYGDEDNTSHIYFNKLIKDLKNDMSIVYKYRIHILDVNGNVYFNGINKLSDGQIIDVEGNYLHSIMFNVDPTMSTVTIEEYIPGLKYIPFEASVNGDFSKSTNGKRDTHIDTPKFFIQTGMKNIKIRCIIDSTTPAESFVGYEFKSSHANESFTSVNGDSIRFFSDSINKANSTKEELVCQIQSEKYNIYDLKISKITFEDSVTISNKEKYKEYKVYVETNTNDVKIVNVNVADVNVDDNTVAVSVDVRGQQNATSSWNPNIHSGYYYYNQHEYFMYNDNKPYGEYEVLKKHKSEDFSIKINVGTKSIKSSSETYNISKSDPSDILSDSSSFFYENGAVYAKPIILTKYYKKYNDKSYYISQPFVFKHPVTSYGSFSVLATANVTCFARAYIFSTGVWTPWVNFNNGDVPGLQSGASAVQVKVELKNETEECDVILNKYFCCFKDYNDCIDLNLSKNVKYNNDHLSKILSSEYANYTTTIFDYGTNSILEMNARYTSNGVSIYFATSDKYEDLQEGIVWLPYSSGAISLKRYYRIKIELDANAEVYYIVCNHMIKATNNAQEGIKEISVSAEYNPESTSSSTISSEMYFNILMDTNNVQLLPDISSVVKQMVKDRFLDYSSVTSINIQSSSNDILVEYDSTVPVKLSPIIARSKVEKFEEYHGEYMKVSNKYIELSPSPQSFSPITIELANDIGEARILKQVFFYDHDGHSSLFNVEEYESKGFKTHYMEFNDIDSSSIVVHINNVNYDDYELVGDNIISFNKTIDKGNIVKITYKLDDSFCANADYAKDTVNININSNFTFTKARINYECNKTSNKRKLNNINLNPIYNTIDSGYIYISETISAVSKIKLFCSTDFVYCDGLDCTNIFAQALDKYDTPVENIKININSICGNVLVQKNITDSNGVVSGIYTGSLNVVEDTITATYDDISSSVTIKNIKKEGR